MKPNTPAANRLLEQVRQKGNGQDTILAHINPQEAELLKSIGAKGTINPKTGLPEFDFWSGIGNVLASIDPSKAISDALASLDNTVRKSIPGGWISVGAVAAAALGAWGFSELADSAEAGTLTTEELSSAGLSDSTITQLVSDTQTLQGLVDTGALDTTQISSLYQSGWDANGIATSLTHGYTGEDLASFADNGWSPQMVNGEASSLNLTGHQILDLANNGWSPSETASIQNLVNGQQMLDLSNGGFTPEEIAHYNTYSGISPNSLVQLSNSGFTPEDLSSLTQTGNFNSNDIKALTQLTSEGYNPGEISQLVGKGFYPGEINYLSQAGYTNADLTSLAEKGFNPTALQNLANESIDPNQVLEAVKNGASTNTIEYDAANGYVNNLNTYVNQYVPTTPVEPPVTPTPVEPPVTPTPVEPPVSPVSPGPGTVNLTSTGISDSPAGTIYTDANGTQEIVLDSGKTVNYADYQAAQGTGNPISVDGQMTTGYNGQTVTVTSPIEIPTEPVAPTTSTTTISNIPQGYQEVPNPIADLPPGSAESQGFQYNETTGEWLNPETGVGYDPTSGKWIAPLASATPGQIAAVVAVGAGAAIAAAAGGGGGAAAGGAGATQTFTGTPTTPGGTPGPTTPGGTPGPTTPKPPVDTTTGPINPTPTPTVTTPGPDNPVQITDYSTPYTTPDGTPVDTTDWSAADIAKAIAAGYLIGKIATATTPSAPNYKQQFFPIPTYNGAGLVNPGVNPGFIEPAPMYATGGRPGLDQYYWGQHGYVQNAADLANYNAGAVNAPAMPYGNTNAVNLGQVITPEMLGFPNLQSQQAIYGPGYTPAQTNYQNVLSADIYHNPVQMNTIAPSIPGVPVAMAPNTQAQMAAGHGQAAQYGQSLNYNFTPAQLATTNNPGMTPATQFTSVSPQQLATQLAATASSYGP